MLHATHLDLLGYTVHAHLLLEAALTILLLLFRHCLLTHYHLLILNLVVVEIGVLAFINQLNLLLKLPHLLLLSINFRLLRNVLFLVLLIFLVIWLSLGLGLG
jgi:hypothetical protein